MTSACRSAWRLRSGTGRSSRHRPGRRRSAAVDAGRAATADRPRARRHPRAGPLDAARGQPVHLFVGDGARRRAAAAGLLHAARGRARGRLRSLSPAAGHRRAGAAGQDTHDLSLARQQHHARTERADVCARRCHPDTRLCAVARRDSEAAARLVVRHLSDRQPVRDAATLVRLGGFLERLVAGFCDRHAADDAAARAQIEAHAGRVWWRAVRSAIRSGTPLALAQHLARQSLRSGYTPTLRDVVASVAVGSLRAARIGRIAGKRPRGG